MITILPERIAALPAADCARCERLFFVQRVEGQTVIPHEMEAWVAGNFGSLEQVRHQTIVRVVNRFTLEGTLFNPLRALRPAGKTISDAELNAWIDAELNHLDFFAQPLQATTADIFGRIRGRFCVTASNIAKYDGWHGLVVFDEPHPLRFNRDQFADYLEVALRWLVAAHRHDPQAIYPMIAWNCLPRSGATIAHGHMQMSLAREMHYTRPELWRRAALQYGGISHYFSDLIAVHADLGLLIAETSAGRMFAHLTPLRNREIVALLPYTADATLLAERLTSLIYPVLRTMIDHHNVRSFNVGIALPPFIDNDGAWRDMPVIARFADRGPALGVRNDWGAMELFATGCVTVDPFEVAGALRRVEA
ncbi:MAG: hypothetical protein NZ699_11430 [Roseiflexus sp.]|nr:hypothetical protein [Roseiflexus sp.]MCS7289731.1 hypothetical protein [Roseiflexus sp.]MDW8232459.1 hypothetical protein [Roseiflexaceae bacterium]